MKYFNLIIIFMWSHNCLSCCFPCKRNGTKHKILPRTGETVAFDNLIRKYEKEHHQFYKKETKNGNTLTWPDMENKNLFNFCKKYLQHSVPTRINDDVIGMKTERTLHYGEKNIETTVRVVIVQCKVVSKNHQTCYYITRAPEPKCVYVLKCKGNRTKFIFTIINKYCDFEGKPLISYSLKRKKAEIVNKIHHNTGQLIAKDEYLMKYEMEHLELLKSKGKNGDLMEWLYAKECHNLNSYCHQYIRACAPRRYIESVRGIWKTQKLHYQKLSHNEDVNVTIITCHLPSSKRKYHITRAPETNCVYALLRKGCNMHYPLVIIFKHCNFEDQIVQKPSPPNYDILDLSLTSRAVMKEENFDSLDTLQLFPNN